MPPSFCLLNKKSHASLESAWVCLNLIQIKNKGSLPPSTNCSRHILNWKFSSYIMFLSISVKCPFYYACSLRNVGHIGVTEKATLTAWLLIHSQVLSSKLPQLPSFWHRSSESWAVASSPDLASSSSSCRGPRLPFWLPEQGAPACHPGLHLA